MCGIAGYVGLRPPSPANIERAVATMGRRGPDATGVYHHEIAGRHVVLAHSRLAIIDLDERANQPFRFGSAVMVFNGELYNYVELRKGLLERGAALRSESDTEVLTALVDLDGHDALDACEGMWAFAAYDESTGRLTLARDRFGEKPLYVFVDDGGVWFASEPKAIVAMRGRAFDINFDHLGRYLVNGYKALYKQPHSFFKGLRSLPRASVLTVDLAGDTTEQSYWRPDLSTRDEAMSYADAVAGTRERLIESVRLRLRADVPVAFCMSGGVDSNSLIAIAKRALGYDVHGFTITNTDARYEESDIVTAAVRELGVQHTSVHPSTSDFLSKLRELVRYHDAPVSTITYFAHWQLMAHIAEHGYRISVSGTAADELFTGYYDHHLFYLAAIAGSPERHGAALAAWRRSIAPLVRNPFLSDPDRFVRQPEFRDHIFLGADEFAATMHAPWHEAFGEQRYVDDVLRNRMLNELFHEAVPVILHEDDANAMYWSIENRSPFLDRELFEFSLRIPTHHLIRDGYAKAVLRDAMGGLVPDAVLASPRKVGFNAPLFDYLDVRDPRVRAEVLDDGPIWDLCKREAIAEYLDKVTLPNSESKFLFSFVNAKLFLEEFGR